MRSKGALKATRNKGEQDPATRPTGPRAIAYAVVSQALVDALDGQRDAQEWLQTASFEAWCDRCGLHPDYLRRSVAGRLPATRPKRARVGGNRAGSGWRYTEEEKERILAMRREGCTWKEIGRAFGATGESIWGVVRRWGYDPATIYQGTEQPG